VPGTEFLNVPQIEAMAISRYDGERKGSLV